MLSQSDLFGSGRLEGVRGGAVRSSERRAIASRVGRLASDDTVEGGGGCAYGEGRDAWGMVGARLLHLRSVGRTAAGEEDGSAAAAAIAALRDALRSFCRRFWNHIVTTLCSLCEINQSVNENKKLERKGIHVQIELSGECFAFFARGVGSAVEELFEHGELGAGETVAGTLCGGVGCAEEAFIGGGAEAGG
jgi:hypothetical protein